MFLSEKVLDFLFNKDSFITCMVITALGAIMWNWLFSDLLLLSLLFSPIFSLEAALFVFIILLFLGIAFTVAYGLISFAIFAITFISEFIYLTIIDKKHESNKKNF